MVRKLLNSARIPRDYSDDELRRIVDEIGEILEIDTVPFNVTSELLAGCYHGLEQNASNYPLIQEEVKEAYKSRNRVVLGVIEFQTSWHVLRHFFPDVTIKSMIPEERNETYLFNLYSYSDKFNGLFLQRESTIEEMAGQSFIELDMYRRPIRHSQERLIIPKIF